MDGIVSIKYDIADIYPCYDCPLSFEYCEVCPCFEYKYRLTGKCR